ncbi:MAG: hypothetical protein KDA51_11760, partial [Planctomycetales bacterium]|nr:hypothetical protein [Planctomycetales bacterium]
MSSRDDKHVADKGRRIRLPWTTGYTSHSAGDNIYDSKGAAAFFNSDEQIPGLVEPGAASRTVQVGCYDSAFACVEINCDQ